MQWGLLGGQGVLLKRPEAGRPRRGLRNPLNTGVLVGPFLRVTATPGSTLGVQRPSRA